MNVYDLSPLASSVADSLAYQKAIYLLLTKDLPDLHKEKIDLLKRTWYLEELALLLSASSTADDAALTASIRGDIAEIEVRLSELDELGIQLGSSRA